MELKDLKRIFGNVPVPVVITDRSFKVVYANFIATSKGLVSLADCDELVSNAAGKSYHNAVCAKKLDKGEKIFYLLGWYDKGSDLYIIIYIDFDEIIKAFRHSKVKPELFLDTSPFAVFLWENKPGWPIAMVSPNVENIFGYTAHEFITGKVSYAEIIHPEDIERVSMEVKENTENRSPAWTHQDYRIITKDGKVKWIFDHTVPIFDEEGNVTYYYGYILDVSEKHEKEEILLKIAYLSPVGIVIYDPASKKVVFSNKIGNELVSHLGTGFINQLEKGKHKFVRSGRKIYKVEFSYAYHEGKKIILVILTDITKEKLLEKKLYKLATRDKLTGIYNRYALNLFMEKLIDYAQRKNEAFAVVLFDVDHFKHINDTYGHHVGDQVLKSIAQNVKKVIRRSDMFGRWGGEEFLIILTSTKDPVKVAEKIRRAVKENVYVRGVHITISAGVAQYRQGDTLDSIILRADNALYEAKKLGKDKTVFIEK